MSGATAATRPPIPTLPQILVVGVVLAAVAAAIVTTIILTPSGCNSCGGCLPAGGQTPLGSPPFALGSPIARGGPTNHSYLIAVVPNSGLRWGWLEFHLTDSRGSNLTPAS
ncbi:MAG TPA: hypothetical protein VGP88_00360, partial [Thermoplasmata archaeon]|nr:hypothetical protein [Thermoplasmata archaeon]